MAKVQTTAYLVTDKSPLSYNGKEVACGEVAMDIPGESIAWLLADGFIVATDTSAPAPTALADAPIDEAGNGK